MNFINKILDIFLTKKGGFVLDTPDDRDYKYEEHFDDEIFGASIPDILLRTVEDLPEIPKQGRQLSCVTCSFTFVNSYNSKYYSDNDVLLSWPMLYCLVRKLSNGTTFRDNADKLRWYGQCINSLLPQEDTRLINRVIWNKSLLTQKMYDNAENYKIEGYFYIKTYNKTAMKTAILKSPIVIGVQCGYNWNTTGVIKWDGSKRYGHAIVITGWSDTKQAWQIADWDGKLKWLDYKYPIMSAITVRDLPDKVKEKNMTLIKTSDSPKVYVLLPNNERQHILSIEQLREGQRQKLFDGQIKIVEQKILDQYPETKNPFMFVK